MEIVDPENCQPSNGTSAAAEPKQSKWEQFQSKKSGESVSSGNRLKDEPPY